MKTNKSNALKNQPIIDYIESIIEKDSVILVHERKLSTTRTIKTMEIGRLPDKVSRKYAANFLESEYYREDLWKVLTDKYARDTIARKWGKNDFTFSHELISNEYVKEVFFNPKTYEKKVIRRVFSFSDILYYDENQYALFSIRIAGNIVFSDSIEDALIIMKRKDGKWVMADKMQNNVFVNP
ncbi:hypothetical protein [Flavobacterium litorale]|uniref:NTF2 fold immunity protein domain-containing protein n=1 Tax=Flavobacterium litorale TaxID=2856519 RepID=A0ABX8V9W9_9FLAO|nr:hypothetical protein [Flavobacterium litorale]QYJ67436.1 hypothetical protein K1I41_07660 [Flavobacterium litorale]